MVDQRLNAWETLFQRALEILDAAPRAGTMLRDWSFGGGTVLMRRHRHRLSTGIDIFLPDPRLLGHLSPRLNPAIESLTTDYDEQANSLKLYFPQGEIDFVVAGSLTANPVTIERIHGRDVNVETSAEIIAKTIWYRGAEFTARDLFDFALVAEREPRALRNARDVLRARRTIVLEQISDREEALREDFAALDALEFRPSFEQCVDAVRQALVPGAARAPHRAEQRRARYRVARAAIGEGVPVEISAQVGLRRRTISNEAFAFSSSPSPT